MTDIENWTYAKLRDEFEKTQNKIKSLEEYRNKIGFRLSSENNQSKHKGNNKFNRIDYIQSLLDDVRFGRRQLTNYRIQQSFDNITIEVIVQ